jgi:hypothetical protein
MPDPAFGFAMVVFFFEDWIPHDYYSYAENLRGVLVSGDLRFFLLGILVIKTILTHFLVSLSSLLKIIIIVFSTGERQISETADRRMRADIG